MGDGIRPALRAGVSFEIERLEHDGDELVVSGHWSGLRGVRFMRPTLVVGEREVLATLEHKPWAPRPDRVWTAAFPWTGGTPDAGELQLAVAPSVTVRLGGPADEPGPALALLPPAGEAHGDARAPAPVPERDPPPLTTDRMRMRLLEQELAGATQERDELRARLEEAQGLLDGADAARAELEASLRHERRAADSVSETRDEVARARAAAERDREMALEQRDEAVQDREAALRTRTRMQIAAEDAERRRGDAEAGVQQAHAERDEAQAQRDEVLLAYRALQRHVHSERAGADRAANAVADIDLEQPLGVRTMPAARTIMAELQRPAPSSKFAVTKFDVWVVRVLGSVAAGCFILLLIAILRVFI